VPLSYVAPPRPPLTPERPLIRARQGCHSKLGTNTGPRMPPQRSLVRKLPPQTPRARQLPSPWVPRGRRGRRGGIRVPSPWRLQAGAASHPPQSRHQAKVRHRTQGLNCPGMMIICALSFALSEPCRRRDHPGDPRDEVGARGRKGREGTAWGGRARSEGVGCPPFPIGVFWRVCGAGAGPLAAPRGGVGGACNGAGTQWGPRRGARHASMETLC
jgi:hypothetical protein